MISLAGAACGKKSGNTQDPSPFTVNYKESAEDFPNPERGFFQYTETASSGYTPLSPSLLQQWKGLTRASNGNYNVYIRVLFRYFVMDNFKDKPLTDAFINNINKDFDIARAAGFKVLPRFSYTNTVQGGSCPDSPLCPPYGDAPKEIVLQHIAQLKQVLHENADVIAAVQMGFIGIWGEQAYTDYFGDPSSNGAQRKLLDENWKDRIEVLKALLDAVPKDRMALVRIPQMKQRALYGVNAPTTVAPLTIDEAFNESDYARIGYHNDCFLASIDDYGTFSDWGNSSSPWKMDLTVLKAYKQQDSKFVAVAGETCDDAYSPQNDCEPAGIAQAEMANAHYSLLNSAWKNEVNDDWQTGGCMENIKKNLGYRFALKKGEFPGRVQAGQSLSFKIELQNKGYASCYNPRPVKLVLRHTGSGEEYIVDTDGDPRRWFSGDINWETSVSLPANMQKGKYKLFLFLPDKYASIASNPDYAIRLANENVWEAAKGYNNLNAEIAVD